MVGKARLFKFSDIHATKTGGNDLTTVQYVETSFRGGTFEFSALSLETVVLPSRQALIPSLGTDG